MAKRAKVYVHKDANQSDWARRRFLKAMTTDEEARKVFVHPLWEQVRPVFGEWIALRERAEAGEPVRDEFLPTSDGAPLLLAAEHAINGPMDLWDSVRLAEADEAWPDLLPLRVALEKWAESIHLAGQDWALLAAVNLIWNWWEDEYPDPVVDFEVFFGHADEADWSPDTGRFEFQDSGWLPWMYSADDYRKCVKLEFGRLLKTYIEKAEQTMSGSGYIPVAFEWSPQALIWFGLHHCGGRTYSQVIRLCRPTCEEDAIAKGVQQVREALGVPPRPTKRGPDQSTRRSRANRR